MNGDPRKAVWEIAETDPVEALRLAREISDDWYRSQSLAAVAWHTKPKAAFAKIASEALASAKKLPNPNRIVSCSAWTIRAMAERPDTDIDSVVDDQLITIDSEMHPVRRADALLLLFEAAYPQTEIRSRILSQLLASTLEIAGWKKDRILSDIALVVAKDSIEEASRIAALIQSERGRRKTNRAIDDKIWLGPHEFFPHYEKIVEAHPVR